MAKKVKTPEETQAAIEKKVACRKIFFGTFRKALAFFLAIAFTFGLVQIAFKPSTVSSGTVAADSNEVAEKNVIDVEGETLKEGETMVDADGNEVTGISKADAVKLLNEATAAAAKAGYDWTRKCYYTRALDVGNATGTLNQVIHMVDENASLDSVVGGFLDITGEDKPDSATKAKGSAAAPEGMKDKFLLKAMSLTEGDVTQYAQEGTTYHFQINACSNPQKDGGNALHRTTDDFITLGDVQKGVADALGNLKSNLTVESADVAYSEIVVVAKIVDGKLMELSLNYLMDVKALNLKALRMINITGNGAGKVEETYTNFQY